MATPVCKTCGGARVPMQTGRGTWYVGCPTCKAAATGTPPHKTAAKKTGAKMAKGAPPPKPKPTPATKEHWLDDYF